VVSGEGERAQVRGVHGGETPEALPVEAVVRGYLIAAAGRTTRPPAVYAAFRYPWACGWPRSYRNLYSRLQPSRDRHHDENIDFAAVGETGRRGTRAQVRQATLALYVEAAEYARKPRHHHRRYQVRVRPRQAGNSTSLIGLDTRFLSILACRQLSGRHQPASFDKQFVRDYSKLLDWNKQAPGLAARRDHRQDQRQVSRGASAFDPLSRSRCRSASSAQPRGRRTCIPRSSQNGSHESCSILGSAPI